MSMLLLEHADVLVTMDPQRREIVDGALLIEENVISWVGASAEIPQHKAQNASRILNMKGRALLPGFVNTHHHFYQNLTRALPAAQNAELFDWLKILYPVWAYLRPEDVHLSTKLAMVELLLSGCTTSSDHHYLWPNGSRLDDQFQAASEVGMRFHRARGSMSLGESKGGLPPDSVTEDEDDILLDCRRVVEIFHDDSRYSMSRVALAPCSPFSVSEDLMRESADLARSFGQSANVHLHTHLAETANEEDFCLDRFGSRPVEYAQRLGWTGDDVWHAHCVFLDQSEIEFLAHSHTGVAHCPTSNMRLSSGIAPVHRMVNAGVQVGLGVDGSASNDGSHLLAEARQALLLQRVQGDPMSMTARGALELATIGGAAVLGRDDVGSIAPGMAADIVAFDLSAVALSGAAVHDPVAALVFCQPQSVDLAIVNGRILVEDGLLRCVDAPTLVEQHSRAAKSLLARAGTA